MEEHFRKKLKNHKVDWDKEELLGSLEQELSKNKSRFNWKLFLLLPLFFIGTCWGLIESELILGKSTDLAQVESTSILNPMKRKDYTNVNQIDNKTKVLHNSSFKNFKSNQLPKSNTSSLSNNAKTQSEFSLDSQSSKSVLYSNPNLEKNNASIFSNKKKQIIQNSTTQNPKITTRNIKHTNHSTSPIAATFNRKISTAIRRSQQPLQFTGRLPILEISMIPFDRQFDFQLPKPTKNSFESIIIKETPKFKSSFFVSSSVEAGVIINQNTKYVSNDSDFLQLLINNEKTETSRILLSTNLSVGYLDQSGWSLQSGLEYNEILGFFKYSRLETDTILAFNETALYILNQNADTLFFGDTSSIVRTTEKVIRHWNKQPYFSIPLEVGYRRAFGNTHVFGTAGISYAFAYKFKGRVNQLNPDGTNEIIDNPEFVLKSRIGYKLSLGTEIPLFKRTRFFMNVSYRRNPKLSGESKEQFYQSCSFGAGIRGLIGR